MKRFIIIILWCFFLFTCNDKKTENEISQETGSEPKLLSEEAILEIAYEGIVGREKIFSEKQKARISEAYFKEMVLVEVKGSMFIKNGIKRDMPKYYYVLHGVQDGELIGAVGIDAISGEDIGGCLFVEDETARYNSSIEEAKDYIKKVLEIENEGDIEFVTATYHRGGLLLDWSYEFKIKQKETRSSNANHYSVYYNPYIRVKKGLGRGLASKKNLLSFMCTRSGHRLFKITEATRSGNNPRMVGID